MASTPRRKPTPANDAPPPAPKPDQPQLPQTPGIRKPVAGLQ